MRVYCAQVSQVWDDPDSAFSRVHDAVLHAVEADADLVMFSEQFATGWRPSMGSVQTGFSGAEVKERWCSLARECGVAVAGSYAREVPGGLPQNVMLVAGPQGEVLAEYAKMHLFTPGGEDRRYSPGVLICGFRSCSVPICMRGVRVFWCRLPGLRRGLQIGSFFYVPVRWRTGGLLRDAGVLGLMRRMVWIIRAGLLCVIMRGVLLRMPGCLRAGAVLRWMWRGFWSGGSGGGWVKNLIFSPLV